MFCVMALSRPVGGEFFWREGGGMGGTHGCVWLWYGGVWRVPVDIVAMAPTVRPPWSFGWEVVLFWVGVGVGIRAGGVGVVVCHCVICCSIDAVLFFHELAFVPRI